MKPYNCVQTNDYYEIELSILYKNMWNALILCLLFVLRIVSWSYNCVQRIVIY